MKRYINKILSILLMISIIFVSVSLRPISAYASEGGGGGHQIGPDFPEIVFDFDFSPEGVLGPLQWADMNTGNKWLLIIEYAVSEFGAVLKDRDFAKALTNKDKFQEYIYSHDPDDFVTDEGLTIPTDLVALIKQALIEYANETNGFKLENTYPMNAIPASTFPNKTAYESFKSFCASHAFTVANPQGSYMYLGDATPYIKEGGGFVNVSSNIVVYNSDWKQQSIPMNYYQFLTDESGDSYVKVTENWGIQVYISHYIATKKNFAEFRQTPYLVTKDGGRIRVFKSATAFMDYDAGQRKVYFGSGFYDFDPTDITATWDDINDKIGRMDDILQDILDAITNNPNISEEDLEKLIDELIGKIGEIGGELGDKADQTNTLLGGISSTLNGISSSLSGYFSSVLSYLSGLVGVIEEGFMMLSEQLDAVIFELGLIYESMGDMTEEEVSEKTDSLLSQLFTAFSEIGDVLKGKFPFCLPNDLYTMLALLAGDEVSVSPGTGGGGGGDGNGDIMICAYGAGDKESRAPVFEIPFVIGSADIEEKIIIDLSPFEYISKLSRTLMTLYFCACLMQLTLKVIDLGKDLGDD